MAKTKKNDPKTYAAKTPDGRTVRCTVPESDNREWPELLDEAIRETLSPEAVAAIAAYLQPCSTKNASVNRQVAWFADRLVAILGAAEFRGLMDELGL